MVKYTAPKGTKDFLPEDQIIRQKIIDTCKEVFELYGFPPMETPGIERLEVLTSKGVGGSEIGKEIFKLKDRAGRELGLRFDLTVPTARVLSQNKQLRLPFKRYQMGKVWRQEFGTRMREFWQCDADTIGSATVLSDVEPILMMRDVFIRLGLNVEIRFNSRALLNKIAEDAGIPKTKLTKVILALDKLEKIGEKGVGKELEKIGVKGNVVKRFTTAKVTDDTRMNEVYILARKLGANAVFDPTLARGLDYYTGIIYEAKTKEYPSSIAAGGRYDKLLSKLGDIDKPAVGVSFGVDRIFEILKKKESAKSSTARVYVVPINTYGSVFDIADQLRKAGIKTDVDLLGRSPSKNLTYAEKMGIPYSLLMGEKELKTGKFSLKNMKTGKEQQLNIKQVIKLLK